MLGVSVKGGTGAGKKRGLRAKPKPWLCRCNLLAAATVRKRDANPGYLVRCTGCGASRPD